MTAFASRPCAGPEDLQSMIDLLMAVRPAERITDYPSTVDLREALGIRAVQERMCLWVDAEGQLVGFALVDLYNNLRFEIAPQASGSEIESQIVAWGVECVRRAIHESGEAVTLDASCRDDDTERIALLKRHGFVMEEMRTLHMVRSLNEPIPAPQVPLGFSIRYVAGRNEVEELVALHRAAFGTKNMTVEERLSMMRMPEYDAELDLLAVTPNGELAAYCTCSISQRENVSTGRNEGYTDTVATHPDFQRQGLAQALMLTGLRLLKERGMDTAVLGTSSKNIAMQQAARAVGFHVQSTTLWFAKPVPEGQKELGL